jgi:hypothetical protein
VDAVITADLVSGKELAKARRKSLNQQCETLRERILETRVRLSF